MNNNLYQQILNIKDLYNAYQLSYELAKSVITELVVKFNARSTEIARKYKKYPTLLRVEQFIK